MSYEKILELMNTLPEDQADFKSKLKGFVTELNQEKGKAAADLITKNKELDSLRKSGENAGTYKEIAKALAKAGVDAKNSDDLMKKLNIQKSIEDENAILKENLAERDKKLKSFEEQQQFNDRKEKIKPLFEKALGEFVAAKQKDGKPNYKLTEEFVDRDTLFKDVDVDNDTLRNDHFAKVLQEADKKQQTFMESTGMGYTKQVHKQGLPQGHYENTNGINTVASDATREVRESKGSFDSVVAGIAQVQAAQREES